uniref:C-type lectin n=1 Tax=Penaeus chinensis TaxID=139456 RepID=A0A173GPG6_PENCE|nr:C-type lectin [Penaeus chinensis]
MSHAGNSSFLLPPDEIEPPITISVLDILHNTEPPVPPQTIPPPEYTTMPAETTTDVESLQNLEFSFQEDDRSSQCPEPFDLVAGDCVLVSGEDERRNYTGAMEYCGRLGAGLASPSDLMALRNYVLLQLGVIHVRVGATRSPELAAWSWPDGRPVPSAAWGPWQPDNAGGQEYCTTLNTNLWWNGPLNDFSCNGLYAFVCQYGV